MLTLISVIRPRMWYFLRFTTFPGRSHFNGFHLAFSFNHKSLHHISEVFLQKSHAPGISIILRTLIQIRLLHHTFIQWLLRAPLLGLLPWNILSSLSNSLNSKYKIPLYILGINFTLNTSFIRHNFLPLSPHILILSYCNTKYTRYKFKSSQSQTNTVPQPHNIQGVRVHNTQP